VALRVPAAEGVKVTLTGQFAAGASVAPQVLVSAKSPELGPVMAMLEIVNVAVPVLMRLAV
jgi:hypothetical protein